MKYRALKTMVIAGAVFMAVPAFGADYSGYSLQELSQMRGTMMDKSPEEKAAFKDAWRTRMQNATGEERAQYARCKGKGHHYGYGQSGGQGSGNCDGSGKGHGHGKGHK
ncbi:MAG: hypothetical protein DSZ23_02750 [Thermodesulfatator sp.]|nr:MAG: hypothetical protein DSZ23_02750 [Thermodesulfatator sp.]